MENSFTLNSDETRALVYARSTHTDSFQANNPDNFKKKRKSSSSLLDLIKQSSIYINHARLLKMHLLKCGKFYSINFTGTSE